MRKISPKKQHKQQEDIKPPPKQQNKTQQKLRSPIQQNKLSKTPIKQKSTTPKKLSPTLSQGKQTKSKRQAGAPYMPHCKQIKLMQMKTQLLYEQIKQCKQHRAQNSKSVYLNSLHPQAPLFQRAGQLFERRKLILQSKRIEQQRLKQQIQQQQYQEYIKFNPSKKVVSKQQAQLITNRLYHNYIEHDERLKQLAIDHEKIRHTNFKDKPEINQNSQKIMKMLIQNKQRPEKCFNRFEAYKIQKSKAQQAIAKQVKQKYFPFKPILESTRSINKQKSPTKQSQKSMIKTIPYHNASCQIQINQLKSHKKHATSTFQF